MTAAREFADALACVAETPRRVAALVAAIPKADLRKRGKGGVFSAVEQACHLRDIEQVGYLLRITRTLEEANPLLEDIDGARLAAERDYPSQNIDLALADFAAARRRSVELLARATPEQLLRTARFGADTSITLAGLVAMMREHDDGHLRELEDLARS